MKAAALKILASILISTLLLGCGGGGASITTGSSSNVYISGVVNYGLWPAASGGTLLQNMANVVVANSTYSGTPITNASVNINGTQLSYNSARGWFEGVVLPDGAGKLVLTVSANGETHTATATALTTLPVVSVPNPFIAAQSNAISWSASGPVVSGATPMSYYVEVVDTYNYGATRLAYGKSTTGSNITVPANTTTATTSYHTTIYASYVATLIGSAASGSGFSVSASGSSVSFVPQ